MRRYSVLGGSSLLALSLSAALAGTARAAEDQASDVDAVVVTGSYIAGAAEDAALPVTAVSAQELQRQGSPSNVDLIKGLPIVGPTIAGDANPLGSSRVEGASSINLRGLSNARTLVLFNGRRAAPISSGTQSLVDINSLPTAAVGRIEVLKDGGAATYGSDAIAGVVNFITSRNFEGLEVSASYSAIAGSDGDATFKMNWGKVFDRGNVLISFGFTHRSELRVTERDWATPDYLENPTAWSTSTNPGIYSIGNSAATAVSFVDPGCEALGGQLTPLASVGIARNCLFQATAFQNLVDQQNMGQLYGELNYDVTDNVEFHIDAFYSHTRADNVATAPSIAPTVFPTTTSTGGPGTGIIPGRFFIPASNPGLQDLLARYSAAQLGLTGAQYTTAQTIGVNAGPSWRPFGLGGNPAFGGRQTLTYRDYEVYRVSGGFSGTLGADTKWDVNVTYGSATAESPGADTIVSRMEYALRGLGGAGCTPGGANPATSTAGLGPCMYFNPFSTGIAGNALTGTGNATYVGHANNAELVDWFTGANVGVTTNSLLTLEAVLNGKLPIFELPGGQIGWAVGAQYRSTAVKIVPDDLSNFNLNPCVDEGAPLANCAAAPTGILSIFGPVTPRDYNQEVKGVFGELSLPFFDSFSMQLAGRYEQHDAGSTFNPKIAVRWQLSSFLALRASAGSTYRAPPQATLDPSIFTTVSQAVGTIRIPFDRTGNPDLLPETADNYNAGFILALGGFKATLDYWRYVVKDQLIIEDGPSLVNALIPASGPNHCGDPAYAALQARFTFFAGGCSTVANVARVKVLNVNGPTVHLSGVDFSSEYRRQDFLGGDLVVSFDATYNIDYRIDAIQQFGLTLQQPFDAVGKLNVGIQPLSLPEWRLQTSLDYQRGNQGFRWQIRYASSIMDQRAGNGTASDITAQVPGFPAGTTVQGGVVVGAFTQHDFYYRWEGPNDLTVNFSVLNVFDTDPPLSRSELSYDAFTANPLGRVFKFGVTKRF